MSAPVEFRVDRIQLPDTGVEPWGYGSAIVAMPGRASVLVSLGSAGSREPWARIDLDTGAVAWARGLRGSLRDAILDGNGKGWLLSEYGLSQVSVLGTPRISATSRPRGMGKHQSRLFPLNQGMAATANSERTTVTVIDLVAGEVVKKIQAGSPSAVVAADDRIDLYVGSKGTRFTLSGDNFSVIGRSRIPTGSGVLPFIDELLMVVDPPSNEPPADGFSWEVPGKRLVALDLDTLAERRSAPAPAGARDVLAVDSADRIVVSTDDGVALIDRRTLTERASLDVHPWPRGNLAHRWVAEAGGVAMTSRPLASVASGGPVNQALLVARW